MIKIVDYGLVNILAFHAMLSPGLALPAALTALQLYLAYVNRDAYGTVLAARSSQAPATLVALPERTVAAARKAA